MKNPANLCTSSAPAPARGLAVSATGERSGCALSPYPWIPAHVAIQSVAVAAQASGGVSEARGADCAAEVVNIPHGNHGVYLPKSLGGVE